MKLVAVKTISWSADASGGNTQFTVEYGSLVIAVPNATSGTGAGKPIIGGWNRVTNQQDLTTVTALS